jgi:hypothetical protein
MFVLDVRQSTRAQGTDYAGTQSSPSGYGEGIEMVWVNCLLDGHKPKVCTGRKHMHAPSIRVAAKREAGRAKHNGIKQARHDKWKEKAAAYWRGEIESYPKHP